MTMLRIVLIGGFTCLSVYLFATAPPPLAEEVEVAGGCQHPVEDLFAVTNHINAVARGIYTKRIVGGGMAAGLEFGEEWREPGVEQGPLPALFLRETAANLEAMPPPLGLYLGSDAPINPSNLFSDAQMGAFETVKATRKPVISEGALAGHVAMYPDIASVAPCVSCHNAHKDSPKTDWRLDDVMGATTWTYPKSQVTTEEFLSVINAMFAALEQTYEAYLSKVSGFSHPAEIGQEWPSEGSKHLPNAEVFMAQVRREAADEVLRLVMQGQKRSAASALQISTKMEVTSCGE